MAIVVVGGASVTLPAATNACTRLIATSSTSITSVLFLSLSTSIRLLIEGRWLEDLTHHLVVGGWLVDVTWHQRTIAGVASKSELLNVLGDVEARLLTSIRLLIEGRWLEDLTHHLVVGGWLVDVTCNSPWLPKPRRN
jgi:hypothetical protein